MDYLVCPGGIEIKADGPEGVIEGWASTFGNTDLGGDVVVKGAFDEWAADVKAGREPMPKITDRHEEAIGVWESIDIRGKGLFVKGAPEQELTAGREAVIRATATPPIYDSLSIGYRVRKGGSEFDPETGLRKLKALNVPEVAVLAFPMNPKARITRVKHEDIIGCKTIRELEHLLRDAGFGRGHAKVVASHGFPGLESLRDAGGSEASEDELRELVEITQRGVISQQLRTLQEMTREQWIHGDQREPR